ncbi:hypothetical protein [Bacillus sp. mrc49]|uniref:hypothetical protein n=1 Tax=Bacillus sp. mrc49 TaxID=2054913 RepID=UPI000C272E54|nr:hypothetical protein [Bacillus sp. mrc49]PJN90456.1 hypothetical protein CVN76_10150 [Bacillus sp. mrc49]
MTETNVEVQIKGSCHNLIPNMILEKVMQQHLEELGFPEMTTEELAFAKAMYDSLTEEEKQGAQSSAGKALGERLSKEPIVDFVAPYSGKMAFMGGSTDVADVSWNVPTAQCTTATWAFGTPFHTWQVVAQGKQSYAHKATLLAGKTMASTAISALLNPEIIEKAKMELKERLNGEVYEALIPKELEPPIMSK